MALILLPGDPYGMGFIGGKEVVVTSRAVAEMFHKRHDNVLQSIQTCECSLEFRLLNFKESYYRNEQNKKQPMTLLTKDGFAFLVMGFTGKKAAQFKELYINRFNEMERMLLARNQARADCRQLTDAISKAHDPAKAHHYKNEMDMLLQVVTRRQAKQLKQERNLPETATIRDYLTEAEITTLRHLQVVAAFLNTTTPDYRERKRLLQEYADRLNPGQIVGTVEKMA